MVMLGYSVTSPTQQNLMVTLHPGRTTSLVTTSVAVMLSICIWGNMDVQPENVFLGTAAYATVLIVFVGATLAPSAPCTCP